MELASLWKFLSPSVEADLEKRRVTLTVGAVTLKGIRLPTLKALTRDRHAIEVLLTDLFIRRGIMWEDRRREIPKKVAGSLRELQGLCTEGGKTFAETRKEPDAILSSLLIAWGNDCDYAARNLEAAMLMENEPADTGMDTSVREVIRTELARLRKRNYPVIDFLIDLLPDGNVVNQQASEYLTRGKDELVRCYRVPFAELTKPAVEIEDR
jgi:hypothetical protein